MKEIQTNLNLYSYLGFVIEDEVRREIENELWDQLLDKYWRFTYEPIRNVRIPVKVNLK